MTGASDNPFSQGGEDYAAFRPTYPPALAEALAAQCAGHGHALDVGCGSGQLSMLLAGCFTSVTATDPSGDQLAHAVSCPGVTYRQEAAERIGLPDASVDLVVAAQAAHWFDLDAFFGEAARVLRPGGAIALVTYGVPEMDGAVGERLQRFYWHDIHRFWPAERRHVETGYRDLAFPFTERAFPALAIERRWKAADLAGYLMTWSAVRAAGKAGCGDVVMQGVAEVEAAWGGDGLRTVRWPITGRLGHLS